VFVLDVSGSMNEPMGFRTGSGDPRAEGETRLSVAKRELIKALAGIPDGGVFNIVVYASDVQTWQRDLVTMSTQTRSEAVAFVESLTAVGGTNIYGAMQKAFDVAGVEEGDRWSAPSVDTVFLLSDGNASVGVTTVGDEILAYVRERNRSAGIVVHTIGISSEQDVYLMRGLAEQNAGNYAGR
jgi:Mg-chelatase subunit ChlD